MTPIEGFIAGFAITLIGYLPGAALGLYVFTRLIE